MLFPSMPSNSTILFQAFDIDIRALMVKVEHYSRVTNLDSTYPRINKAFTQFTVFSTILHPFVKASCSKNITSPTR